MSGGHWRRFCFIATLLLLFALPELIAGAFGTVLPLTGALICYLTLIYSWRTGIAAGFAVGVVLDLAFGRDFPWLVIAFAFLVLIAWGFRHNREFRDWPDLILPMLASLAGMELIFFIAELSGCDGSWEAVAGLLGLLVWNCVWGTLLGCLVAPLLDWLAGMLGLPHALKSERFPGRGKIRYPTVKVGRRS